MNSPGEVVAVEDEEEPGDGMRQMEMLTIPLPPGSGLKNVDSAFVAVWAGGGGNLLHDTKEQDFLDSFHDETNIAEALPEFSDVKYNPQRCDHFLKLEKADKDGRTNISEIRLSKTSLTGSIPANIGNCTSLCFINISFNELTGELPESVGELVNCTEFWASHNQLTGGIPLGFCKLQKLEKLSLNANKMSGQIPKDLAKCRALRRLNLTHNYMDDIEAMEVFFEEELSLCETIL